jgi:hypothetical protein
MVYYQIFRGNGYSPTTSFLGNLAASTFWEAIGEQKEVISINDQIYTSIGGSIIAEPMFRTAECLRKIGLKSAKILAAFLDPNGLIYSDNNHECNIDKTLSTMELSAIVGNMKIESLNEELDYLGISGKSELLNKVGRGSGTVGNIPYSNIEIEIVKMAEKIKSRIKSEVALFMKYNTAGPSEVRFLLPTFAFQYDYRGADNGFLGGDAGKQIAERDYESSVRIMGAKLFLSHKMGAIQVKAKVHASPSFSIVGLDAAEEIKNLYNANDVENQMYYFGTDYMIGTHAGLDMEACYGGSKVCIGGSYEEDRYNSIDSTSQRRADLMTENLSAKKEVRQLQFFLRYMLTKKSGLKLLIRKRKTSSSIYGSKGDIHGESEEEEVRLEYIHKF